MTSDQNLKKLKQILFHKKIETDTISKIKKTPYWSDYEEQAQENMIGKYFDSKIKREGTEYTKEERNMFVRNILDLIK